MKYSPFVGMGHTRFVAIWALATFAACSSGIHSVPSINYPDVAQPAIAKASYLYVANFGNNTINEYAPESMTIVRRIKRGINLPTSIAFDSVGDLYVANAGNNTVTAYSSGSTSPKLTIRTGIEYPLSMVFDAKGNLYVANSVGQPGLPFGSISVYGPNSSHLMRTINGSAIGIITEPYVLALDSRQTLYAANVYCCGNQSSIMVFSPGAAKPARTIQHDLTITLGMIIDPANNMYVADYFGPKWHPQGAIVAFRPGASSAFRIITNGADGPIALAVDHARNLYVANYPDNYGLQCSSTPAMKLIHQIYRHSKAPASSGASAGSVTVYAAASESVKRTIMRGISCPYAMAVDSVGKLYVANLGSNAVTVYDSTHNSPVRVLKTAVDLPYALTFGPR